jgi:MoxR-like ATPase
VSLSTKPKAPQLQARQNVLQVIEHLNSEVLQGKERAIRLAMTALLAGGHLLLEDIPGLGKTTLALALAKSLGLSFGRVQCTSDLLPSDITGLSILDRNENRFRFVKGPIFNHIVLVDEINRAMPKTQSALLEAMEERRVTIEGTTYPLPEPFLVIATQNPTDQVGTFMLPESQLDRFLLATGLGYPQDELEKQIIRHGGIRHQLELLTPRMQPESFLQAQQAAQQVYLGDKLVDYIHTLVSATRRHPMIQTGLSTRSAINLAEVARTSAFLAGGDYVIPEDVQEAFGPVGAHRLMLRPEQSGLSKLEVLQSLANDLPVPLA